MITIQQSQVRPYEHLISNESPEPVTAQIDCQHTHDDCPYMSHCHAQCHHHPLHHRQLEYAHCLITLAVTENTIHC